MERPSKRLKLEDPGEGSPRDSDLQMALATPQMGYQSHDTDAGRAIVTPTTELNDYQRRAIFGSDLYNRAVSPVQYQRRDDATATVTVPASQVVINVNDGTSTVMTTTIPTATTDSVISFPDLGSVTIPANLTSIPTITQTGSDTTRSTSGGSSTGLTSTGSSSTTVSSTTFSMTLPSVNGTITSSTSSKTTITVTTTSTLEVSYLNGTLFPVVVATTINSESSMTEDSFTNTATGLFVTEDDSASATTAAATGDNGVGAVGATVTSAAPSSTSSQAPSGGGGAPTLSPQQQQVVGGVVGSIAGVALILVFILFLLRRYRMRLKAQGRLPEQIAERNMLEGGENPPHMSHRSSAIPLTATLASSLRRFRPYSSQTQATDATASTVPESERGFQKIAGRKIAPVLSTGGDGYGGDYGAFSKESGGEGPGHHRNESSLADSSFYRDSQGFYGGRGTESPTYPPSPTIGTMGEKAGPSSTRDFAPHSRGRSSGQGSVAASPIHGTATLRQSPARTPVTVSPAPSSIRLPIQQTPDMAADAPPVPPLIRGLQPPDGVGRTLVSQDGSRVSARSRASTKSRFAENV